MTAQTAGRVASAVPAPTSAGGGARRRRRNEALVAYALITPALLAFVLFMAIPMLLTLVLSLFNWTGISLGSLDFAGLDNYRKLFADQQFWGALQNNVLFILLGMTGAVALGMFLAVRLERAVPGSSFFRGLFFMPTVLSTVVIAIVFTFLLSPVFGIVTPILKFVGIEFKQGLLGDPNTALYTIIAVEIWRAFGFAMFLFVAGLKGLDHNLIEAARLDGANDFQIFWRITFPILRPVTLLVATLVGIQTLKLFDLVYVMTGGGPQHASEVLTTFSYSEAFNYNNVGYGSAIAVMLLVITFLLTILRFKILPDSARDETGSER